MEEEKLMEFVTQSTKEQKERLVHQLLSLNDDEYIPLIQSLRIFIG